MKAVVWTAYGPPNVLKLQEVEKPTPKANEVLIKIYAATVTAGDCEARDLRFPLWIRLPMRAYIGLRKPTRVTVLGMEFAGEVEVVGTEVSRFKVGDPVMAITDMHFGAYAEYRCVAEDTGAAALVVKPTNLSFEEAAALPLGGLEAIHFLRLGNLQVGESLLINGAGGSIGTAAVQLAKHFGTTVTAVDSAPKLPMLQWLGADHVIDYAKEDFTRNGQRYDVIFDVVGKSPYGRTLRSLRPGGRYLIANPTPTKMLRGLWTSRTSDKRVIFQFATHEVSDLTELRELAEAGKLRPVIDRRYPLSEVAAAHTYVETGQKAGNVIISIAPDRT